MTIEPLLRLGGRPSELSRRQIEMAADRLLSAGVRTRAIYIDSVGDRDLATPVDAFSMDDPFVRDINSALIDGRVDLAVHSAKDLPLCADPALVDAAYLPRGSTEDVLVTRSGEALSLVAEGARIGTSCSRRGLQLRQLRPDIVPVPIRGNVPARVAAVDRGEYDGVVLAAAGLERLGLHARIAERFDISAIMPAPAQGAIVVQCRADSPWLDALRSVDDSATRLPVEAELAFARALYRDDCVAAANAVVIHGAITICARLVDRYSNMSWDATLRGRDPRALGVAVANAVRVAPSAHSVCVQ